MTLSDTEEFKHAISVLSEESSATEQYCSQASVNNHRKFKAKLKSSIENGTDLEYTDSVTGATAKLSGEVIFEFNAFQSFKAAMQNELGPRGPRLQFSLDITKYSREDFLGYLGGTYDQENPDKYDRKLAHHSALRRLSSLPRQWWD